MSDTDKPTPESPNAGTSEATSSTSASAANVISIEQARSELLRKPRSRTPPKGTASPRSRGREVPAPVTLPPGEHAAVIVTDTPAARAHIDKRTVHPGEVPAETTEKKVRVKTQYDPRRQKTQVTDRRVSTPAPGETDVGAMFSNPPAQPAEAQRTSQPPPITGSLRPSLVRPRPITTERSNNTPLFLIGVAIAAALGAVIVYMLSRPKTQPSGAPPAETTSAAAIVSGSNDTPTAPATVSGSNDTPTAATATSAGSEPATTVSVTPDLPSAVPAVPVKTATSAAPRPTGTASVAPTASAKPTQTSILPFGKGEP